MYEPNKGAGPMDFVAPLVVAEGTILPNTSGNKLVTGVAIATVTVGVVIVVSTIVRFAVKKAHKA